VGVTFPHGETVTVRRLVTVPDDSGFGQDYQEWQEETWSGVAFAPAGSTETLADGSTRVEVRATLYDPLGRVPGVRDQIVARGVTYAVNGEASGMWRNPWTGWDAGSTVSLEAVTGG
jgi:hypothetical protein